MIPCDYTSLRKCHSLPEMYVSEPPQLEECVVELSKIVAFEPTLDQITLIMNVKKTLEAYKAVILGRDLERQIKETVLKDIQVHVSRGITQLRDVVYVTEDCKLLFQDLSDCQICLNSLLLNNMAEKSWLELGYNLIWQSNSPQEIKWKFKKYESLLSAVIQIMKSVRGEPVEVIIDQIKIPPDYIKKMESHDYSRFTLENLDVIRKIYRNNFIAPLREQLKLHPNDPALMEVCYNLYCNVTLDENNASIIDLFDIWGTKCLKEKTYSSQFKHSEVIEIDFLQQRIDAVPSSAKIPLLTKLANSLRGVSSRDFDPNMQGNPTHHLYSLTLGNKSVKSLGFGSPTIEDLTLLNSAKLCPEFKAFLKYCKIINKKHLFVMNQDITSNGYFIAEKPRCDLVINLQDEEEYQGTYFAIALSKNSPFYNQTDKEYPNTTAFIEDLLGQFKVPNSGCVIHKKILEVIGPDLIMICNAIHQILFKGNLHLEKDDRLIFIEVFYDELTKWLIWKFNIDSYSTICKDAIDRGAASNAQLYAHLAIVNGIFDENHQKRTMVLMLARSLLVRKRPPRQDRVCRFLQTLDFYLDHQIELKKLHRYLFGEETFCPSKP